MPLTIGFSSTDSAAELPGAYVMSAEDAGVHVFEKVRFGTLKVKIRQDQTFGPIYLRGAHEDPERTQ